MSSVGEFVVTMRIGHAGLTKEVAFDRTDVVTMTTDDLERRVEDVMGLMEGGVFAIHHSRIGPIQKMTSPNITGLVAGHPTLTITARLHVNLIIPEEVALLHGIDVQEVSILLDTFPSSMDDLDDAVLHALTKKIPFHESLEKKTTDPTLALSSQLYTYSMVKRDVWTYTIAMQLRGSAAQIHITPDSDSGVEPKTVMWRNVDVNSPAVKRFLCEAVWGAKHESMATPDYDAIVVEDVSTDDDRIFTVSPNHDVIVVKYYPQKMAFPRSIPPCELEKLVLAHIGKYVPPGVEERYQAWSCTIEGRPCGRIDMVTLPDDFLCEKKFLEVFIRATSDGDCITILEMGAMRGTSDSLFPELEGISSFMMPSWSEAVPLHGITFGELTSHASTFVREGDVLVGRIIIFLKTHEGKTIALHVQETALVEEVMEIIETKTEVPVHQQRLVFAGRCLEHGSRLTDFNICAESTLHLILRLRGGGDGGEGITFADVRRSETVGTRRADWGTPRHELILGPGIFFRGRCIMHGEGALAHIGLGPIDVVNQSARIRCNTCGLPIVPTSYGLFKAKACVDFVTVGAGAEHLMLGPTKGSEVLRPKGDGELRNDRRKYTSLVFNVMKRDQEEQCVDCMASDVEMLHLDDVPVCHACSEREAAGHHVLSFCPRMAM